MKQRKSIPKVTPGNWDEFFCTHICRARIHMRPNEIPISPMQPVVVVQFIKLRLRLFMNKQLDYEFITLY